MKTTIDSAGRIVIPKPIRREAGLHAGSSLEIRWTGEQIEIVPAPLLVRFVQEGRFLVAVPLERVDALTAEVVESTRQALLRERGPGA